METLEIKRGDSEVLSLVFTDENGDAYNLTGGTVFFTIKYVFDIADNDDDALLQKSQSVHTNAAGGLTEITLTAANTRALAVGQYKGDYQFVGSDNSVKSTETIKVKVLDDVTKDVL